MSVIIKTGDSIIISAERREVKCKIEYMDESASFFTVIAPPGTFRVGKACALSYLTSEGMYAGAGSVVKAERPEEATLSGLVYFVKVARSFKKIQKRNYVRHDCYLDVKINVKGQVDVADGIVVNISAGGAKIVTNTLHTPNSVIILRTSLDEIVLDAEAIILEVVQQDKMLSAYKYAMRIKFINLRRRNEEAIVKYIFEEYRKRRAKDKVNKTN